MTILKLSLTLAFCLIMLTFFFGESSAKQSAGSGENPISGRLSNSRPDNR